MAKIEVWTDVDPVTGKVFTASSEKQLKFQMAMYAERGKRERR